MKTQETETTAGTPLALSRLDLLILGLLCGRPMHGYELNQILNGKQMSWVDVSRSSTYKALERAKKRNLVVENIEKQTDKPFRSVFCVTNQGREAFFASLRQLWREPPKVAFEDHIGVFFLNLLPEEEAAELLEERLDSLKRWMSTQPDKSESYPINVMRFSTLDFIKDRLSMFVAEEIKMYDELASALRGQSTQKIDTVTPAFSGNLHEFELVNIIKLLVDGRRTGTLYLTRNLAVNALHFKEGHIIGLSNHPAAADGLAADTQHELPKARQKKMDSLLAEIYAAFSVSDGRFSFECSVRDDYLPIKLTTLEFLREGCRQINDWDRIRSLVSSPAMVFDWAVEKSSAIVNLDVSVEEQTVLAQVNGMRSVQDIASVTGLSLFRVSKILYVYNQLGTVVAVSGDRRELLHFSKSIVELLLKGSSAILTKGEMGQLTAEIAKLGRQKGIPLEFKAGRVTDGFEDRVDVVELEDMIKGFLNDLVDVLKARVGEAVVDDLLHVFDEQLTPETRDLMARYGLSRR